MPVIIIKASPTFVIAFEILLSATGLINMPAIRYTITCVAIFTHGVIAIVKIVLTAAIPAVLFTTETPANTISVLSAK